MWEIFPTFVNDCSASPTLLAQEWLFSAISSIWHGLCNISGMAPDDPVPVQGERQ
jgi:hypothetical protein